MINRREFLGMAAGAGATLALSPTLLRALQQSSASLLERAIPSTGEKLPVVGLSFSNHVMCSDHAALKDVLRTFAGNGGRVFDAVHASNPAARQFHASAASELGLQDKLFWSLPGAPTGGGPQAVAPAAKAYVETLLASHGVAAVDLIMMSPSVAPAYLAEMREEKKAGRVRYIGVQVIADGRMPQLEAVIRNEAIDFVGVNYDVGSRVAEQTILPLAQERKIAVVALFPFSNNAGASCGSGRNLFARVGNRPVPEWAGEFDATTWGQFFLKYVISHPAVTVARVGTSKTTHMLDNIGGGAGRLPDDATRRRMAAFIDALPPLPPNPAVGLSLPPAILDRYVSQWQTPAGMTVTFRRDADRLLVKPGSNPEVPMIARSETRFADPRGPVFEFQVDAQGNVTGLTLEEGNAAQRVTLHRK